MPLGRTELPIFFFSGIFLVQNMNGPLKWTYDPCPNSIHCKNQDFDGPFEILMGHLEKMMGQRHLNIRLMAK